MPKRVFKGLLKPATFEQDMQQFAEEYYGSNFNTGADKQQFIGDTLKQHDEVPFIDWHEVMIFSKGYFASKRQEVENG